MALPVTMTVQFAPETGYQFVYSSLDPDVLRWTDGIAEILVPSGLQMVSFALEPAVTGVTGATAAFIDQPVVWLNDVGGVGGTPSGMSTGRLSSTELVVNVNNTNVGPIEIPLPFFLVVLITGPTGFSIVGRDPILIEEPPGG